MNSEYRGISIVSIENAAADIRPYFSDDDQLESLLNVHIIGAHYLPYVMARFGIPEFDIQLAKYLGVSLDEAVTHGVWKLQNLSYKKTNLSGKPHVEPIVFRNSGMRWTRTFCEVMLGKTLIHIAQQGLSTVNLGPIYEVVPQLQTATIDLERDSYDPWWNRQKNVGTEGFEPPTFSV